MESNKHKSMKQRRIRRNILRICNNKESIVLKIAKDYVGITLGTVIMATGIALFLLPNELSTGGFAGISTITYYLLKFPLGTTMLVLNIPLLLIAFFRISKGLF